MIGYVRILAMALSNMLTHICGAAKWLIDTSTRLSPLYPDLPVHPFSKLVTLEYSEAEKAL
jgi:hypothetical protein